MMNRFLISVLLPLSLHAVVPGYDESEYDESKWVKAQEIYFPKDRPNLVNGVFFNSYTGVGAHRSEWVTENLTGIVPEGTKAIFLSGIALITHGMTSEIADLHLSFRRTGNEEEVRYLWQVCETDTKGGQRSGVSLWVSLNEDLCFDWRAEWPDHDDAPYPCYSAYGLNLSINAFAR